MYVVIDFISKELLSRVDGYTMPILHIPQSSAYWVRIDPCSLLWRLVFGLRFMGINSGKRQPQKVDKFYFKSWSRIMSDIVLTKSHLLIALYLIHLVPNIISGFWAQVDKHPSAGGHTENVNGT